MTRFALTLAAVAVLVGFAPAQDDAAKKAVKELQGSYTLKSAKMFGEAAPAEFLKQVKEFVIKDNQIVVVKADGKEDPAEFKLDPGAKPASIDMIPSKDKTGEKPKLGVYKLEKDELTIVFSMDDDSKRPTDLKGDGKDHMLVVLVKKK
jgi:uncharacterized protein (TIGR03067 family)